jgi:uncharacterized protein (DUF302 family)
VEDHGLVSVASAQGVAATVNKFVAGAKQVGLTVFGQRDFQASRPTVLVFFGNPNVLGRLVGAKQEIGLDLPGRVLVWEGADGKTTVTYTDPRWLFRRHGLPQEFGDLGNNMASVLESLVKNACSEQTTH